MRGVWLRWAVCVGVLGRATVALGADRDPAAAQVLFEEGRDALQRGNLTVACSKFRESERLDPGVGTLLNLADCEEKAGRLASAWQTWREAIDMMGQSDERLSFARGRSSALDRRVPRLTITLAGADGVEAHVWRDEVELGSASFGSPLPVDPGTHTVRVTAVGHAEKQIAVTMAEGERKSIEVKPGPRNASPVVGAAAPAAMTASTTASRPARTWGWISIAAGGAAVAGAVTTGLLMAGDKKTVEEHCDQNRFCDAAGYDAARAGEKLLIPNVVLWGLGATGVGLGAYLLLSSRESKATTALTVRAASGGGLVTYEGRF
jgi:hypothetical protein